MDKLKMQTANKADENFKKLAAMFPNAVTETVNENGEVVRAIDKDIFFVAETKGTMETLELRPIEQAKISCAKKLFNEMSTSHVVYHDVDSYQSLLNIMNSL